MAVAVHLYRTLSIGMSVALDLPVGLLHRTLCPNSARVSQRWRRSGTHTGLLFARVKHIWEVLVVYHLCVMSGDLV